MRSIFFIVVGIIFGGCDSFTSPHQQFFEKPPNVQASEIHHYPLDEQISLMILGMQQEPPQNGLVAEVAKKGEVVLPPLLHRLPIVEDEQQLGAILYCLLEIDLRHYEWKNDPKYVPLLRQELAKMTDPALRQEATRALVSEAGSPDDSRESSPES